MGQQGRQATHPTRARGHRAARRARGTRSARGDKEVQFTEQAVTEEPPEPPQKSPRTLHREHVQALAAERRALAQAKQAHYESLFDRNLSW